MSRKQIVITALIALGVIWAVNHNQTLNDLTKA